MAKSIVNQTWLAPKGKISPSLTLSLLTTQPL
jgi:hypothetical protein